MTDAERRQALEAIAAEVRSCTDCRLHQGRTRAVPGEGDPDTEVVFVGEGPGFNEDRLGRPFVGRAGDLLVKLLATIGWRREDVFITNVVKCRPPDNRDPQPDEIAACAKYLKRQLEVLDPAVVVTLGRHSMARFMPGARISQAHGTVQRVDPATGALSALVYAMYHPAAALRTPSIERESYADIAGVPAALVEARGRREPTGPVRAAQAQSEPVAEAEVAPRVEAEAMAEAVTIVVATDVITADASAAVVESAAPAPAPGPAPSIEPIPPVDEPQPTQPAAPSSEPTPQLTLF